MKHRPKYFWETNKPSLLEKIKNIDLGTALTYLFLIIFFSNILLVFVLVIAHPNIQIVAVNPRPIYFYDIDASCSKHESLIATSLKHLSDKTGVGFVRLSSPLALVFGGLSYSCEGMLTTPDAIGESESGTIGISFIVISWNRITVLYPDEETVLHETLHSMSFGHSDNSGSIMYPYHRSSSRIDSDIVDFIKLMYVSNPLAYLNIIPLNLHYIIILIVWVLYDKLPRK